MELKEICKNLSNAEAHFLLEEIAEYVEKTQVQRWVMSDYAKGYEFGKACILNEICQMIKEYEAE